MSCAIALSDAQWELVADLFDPPSRQGAPAVIPRWAMVDAMLFIARTGMQWRYLPAEYQPWTVVWSQWRRWRANRSWASSPHAEVMPSCGGCVVLTRMETDSWDVSVKGSEWYRNRSPG